MAVSISEEERLVLHQKYLSRTNSMSSSTKDSLLRETLCWDYVWLVHHSEESKYKITGRMKDMSKDRTLPDLNDLLQGKIICLRQPRPEEMKFIRWLWSDPETMKPVGGPFDLTDQEAHEWFVRGINPGRSEDCYCLIFTKQGQPVGEIGFYRLHRPSIRLCCN